MEIRQPADPIPTIDEIWSVDEELFPHVIGWGWYLPVEDGPSRPVPASFSSEDEARQKLADLRLVELLRHHPATDADAIAAVVALLDRIEVGRMFRRSPG